MDRPACQVLEDPHGCDGQADRTSLTSTIGLLKLSVRLAMRHEYLREPCPGWLEFGH
jgi:hypothetical protein